MYKHILAQHSIWRLREMLKPYLKPWRFCAWGWRSQNALSSPSLCTHTEFLAPERKKLRKSQTDNFCTDFHVGKVAMSFSFCVAVSGQTLVLFGELFFYFPAHWCWNWKHKCAGRSLCCSPPPSTCTGTNCSAPGAQQSEYCVVFVDTCDTPETPGHLRPLWAQQGSALQSAVNSPGCQEGGFHPSLRTTTLWTSPCPRFRELMQCIVVQCAGNGRLRREAGGQGQTRQLSAARWQCGQC